MGREDKLNFLPIEDSVASALIFLIECSNCNEVKGEQLRAYEEAIRRYMKREYDWDVIFLIDRKHFKSFQYNYENIFDFNESSETKLITISLNKNKTVDYLREVFRAYLPVEILIASSSEECLKALGIDKKVSNQDKVL